MIADNYKWPPASGLDVIRQLKSKAKGSLGSDSITGQARDRSMAYPSCPHNVTSHCVVLIKRMEEGSCAGITSRLIWNLLDCYRVRYVSIFWAVEGGWTNFRIGTPYTTLHTRNRTWPCRDIPHKNKKYFCMELKKKLSIVLFWIVLC